MMLVIFTSALIVFSSGCPVAEEPVKEINQKIQNRYNSFSTMKYTTTEVLYENNLLIQKAEFTELIKKPDKRKQIRKDEISSGTNNHWDIFNGNTLYSQSTNNYRTTPPTIYVYEYINLLPEMTTYSGYYINKGSEKWKIPMAITDETKYKVETLKVNYNGIDAIKAVVTVLMSEEAKQKQIAIGNTPKESVYTYWFDSDSLAILKEEHHGIASSGEAVAQKGGNSTVRNIQVFETRAETIYEGFYFDIDIPDSEFEVNASDYPGVKFIKEVVDLRNKLN